MKTTTIVLLLALLAGCATPYQYAEKQCKNAGIGPGNARYGYCMQVNVDARMRQAQAISNIGKNWPQPKFPTTTRTQCHAVGNQINCTSSSF